jgi:hypothetical protein
MTTSASRSTIPLGADQQSGGGSDGRPDLLTRVLEVLIVFELLVFVGLVTARIVMALA